MKNKQKVKTIYLISPQISFSRFKLLQDKLVDKEGPWPVSLDKVLWQLLKENRIYCWFEKTGDMEVGLKLPKFAGENVKIIK